MPNLGNLFFAFDPEFSTSGDEWTCSDMPTSNISGDVLEKRIFSNLEGFVNFPIINVSFKKSEIIDSEIWALQTRWDWRTDGQTVSV